MGCCFTKKKTKETAESGNKSPKPLKPIIVKEKENKDPSKTDDKKENNQENTIIVNTYENDEPDKVNLSVLVSEESELKTEQTTTILDEDDDRYKTMGKVGSRESIV
ncbi:unnamed protein product [Dimorphilus gyrociliatus]|uniref:Uncharacterized protein n=1 Tax=Dimorphilus gyrociliatus TaxID=2664684 RepID=A0A7I8VNR7_9ANNE|nr:unnamed protein product [Dimorphilus gyrociliatus]